MREDMYKVIVERPRRGKDGYAAAARLRNDYSGPTRLRTRAGYGCRSLNENLAPLRRYLRAQVGRPWDKVFSEICANIDRRNTVQQHIHQHIRDFIATDVGFRDGQLVELTSRRTLRPSDSGIYQELYVDPNTGLIRINKAYESWRQVAARRRARERAEIARYDVMLRLHVSRTMSHEFQQCKRLYGSDGLYAVSKWLRDDIPTGRTVDDLLDDTAWIRIRVGRCSRV